MFLPLLLSLQSIMALSTTQVRYIAIYETCKEVIWFKLL